jgi:hypothetical protein
MRTRNFACTHIGWHDGIVTRRAGLRERKKQATRKALREAALRLAMERGPDSVRVDDTAEREARVAAAVATRPPDVPLADAVADAVAEQYTDPGERGRGALLLITTSAALRDAFLSTAGAIEQPLAGAIAARLDGVDERTARVLAASVAAAVRVALQQWLRSATDTPATSGLVVVSGSLPDLLRAALEPLTPALDAAEGRQQRRRHR